MLTVLNVAVCTVRINNIKKSKGENIVNIVNLWWVMLCGHLRSVNNKQNKD